MAHRAVATGYETFRVPWTGATGRFVQTLPDDYHNENADYLHSMLGFQWRWFIKRYKDRSSTCYLADRIYDAHAKLLHYCKLTKAKTSCRIERVEAMIDEANRLRDGKWLAYMEPKAVERRERVAARKLAKEALIGEMS